MRHGASLSLLIQFCILPGTYHLPHHTIQNAGQKQHRTITKMPPVALLLLNSTNIAMIMIHRSAALVDSLDALYAGEAKVCGQTYPDAP